MRKIGLFLVFAISLGASLGSVVAAQSCDVPAGATALERGAVLYACGDLEGASVALDEALSATADPLERANVQMVQGKIAYDQADYLGAQTAFERAFLAYNGARMPQESGRAYFYAGQAKEARNLIGEALTYYREGVRQSTAAEDTENLGRLQDSLGRIHFIQGEYEDAVMALTAALDAHVALDNRPAQAQTLRFLGEVALDTGDLAAADDHFTQMVAIAEDEGLGDTLAQGLLQLGVLDGFRGAYDVSFDRLTRALRLFEAAEDAVGITRAYIALSDLHIATEQYTEAFAFARSAQSNTNQESDCPGHLMAETAEAMYEYHRGNYVAAESQFSRVINTADIAEGPCAGLNPRIRAAALYGRGLVRIENRLLVTGGDDLQFALTAYRNATDPIGEHRVMMALGQLELNRNRVEESLEYAYTALRLAEETGSITGQINTYFLLSDTDRRQRRFDDARDKLEIVLDLATANDNAVAQGRALDAISNLYLQQARFTESLEFLERAAEAYPTGNDTYEARILFTRGRIYEMTGDYDLAETFYDRARNGFEGVEELNNMLQVELAIASMYETLNRTDDAMARYSDALETARGIGDRTAIAQAQLRIGTLELLLWDQVVANSVDVNEGRQNQVYDRVTDRFVEAYNIYVESEDLNGQAESLNRIGMLGMRRPIPANWGTGGFFQEALGISRQLGNRVLEADILNNLAEFHERSGQLGTAIGFFNQSFQIADELDPVLAAQIKVKLGVIYERQGDRFNAIQTYQEATDRIEAIYANFSTGSNVRDFGAEELYLLPYERLIRIYGLDIVTSREQDWQTAFNYTESSRARSFLFQLGGQTLQFADSEDGSALQEWYSLREEIISINQRITELRTSDSTVDVSDLEAEIETLSLALDDLEARVELGALRQLVSIDTVEMVDLQASLPADTAMISYYVLKQTSGVFNEGGRVFIFVITQDSITVHAQLFNDYDTDIAARVNTFRNNPLQDAPLAVLYQSLVTPVEPQLTGYDNLIVIPHDVLNYVPFEALPNAEGTPMVANYNISYSPSATVYALMAGEVSGATDGGAQAVFQHGDDLFFAEEEAQVISDIIGAEPLLGDAATETAFRQQIADADVIHVAAHGVFDPLNPLNSHLALAGDDENDGLLQVSEIYGLSFGTYKPLVVLSACETAVSTVNPGDEVQGMTRAFLLTGARGVVASLWAVDDITTSELMSAFYSNRASGMSDSEALAAAKRELAETYPEPYFWAGFVLVGVDN